MKAADLSARSHASDEVLASSYRIANAFLDNSRRAAQAVSRALSRVSTTTAEVNHNCDASAARPTRALRRPPELFRFLTADEVANDFRSRQDSGTALTVHQRQAFYVSAMAAATMARHPFYAAIAACRFLTSLPVNDALAVHAHIDPETDHRETAASASKAANVLTRDLASRMGLLLPMADTGPFRPAQRRATPEEAARMSTWLSEAFSQICTATDVQASPAFGVMQNLMRPPTLGAYLSQVSRRYHPTSFFMEHAMVPPFEDHAPTGSDDPQTPDSSYPDIDTIRREAAREHRRRRRVPVSTIRLFIDGIDRGPIDAGRVLIEASAPVLQLIGSDPDGVVVVATHLLNGTNRGRWRWHPRVGTCRALVTIDRRADGTVDIEWECTPHQIESRRVFVSLHAPELIDTLLATLTECISRFTPDVVIPSHRPASTCYIASVDATRTVDAAVAALVVDEGHSTRQRFPALIDRLAEREFALVSRYQDHASFWTPTADPIPHLHRGHTIASVALACASVVTIAASLLGGSPFGWIGVAGALSLGALSWFLGTGARLTSRYDRLRWQIGESQKIERLLRSHALWTSSPDSKDWSLLQLGKDLFSTARHVSVRHGSERDLVELIETLGSPKSARRLARRIVFERSRLTLASQDATDSLYGSACRVECTSVRRMTTSDHWLEQPTLTDAAVLLWNYNSEGLRTILEDWPTGNRPLVIVRVDHDWSPRTRARGHFDRFPEHCLLLSVEPKIKNSERHRALTDLVRITGARVICSGDHPLSLDVVSRSLGQAERVSMCGERTVLIEGRTDVVWSSPDGSTSHQ